MKTKTLWLCYSQCTYILSLEEPVWDVDCDWDCWDICGLETNCGDFESACKKLKIPKNTKQKLKLTQLKNGIKLEKVGKPIKG